jgi:hypothetical protein
MPFRHDGVAFLLRYRGGDSNPYILRSERSDSCRWSTSAHGSGPRCRAVSRELQRLVARPLEPGVHTLGVEPRKDAGFEAADFAVCLGVRISVRPLGFEPRRGPDLNRLPLPLGYGREFRGARWYRPTAPFRGPHGLANRPGTHPVHAPSFLSRSPEESNPCPCGPPVFGTGVAPLPLRAPSFQTARRRQSADFPSSMMVCARATHTRQRRSGITQATRTSRSFSMAGWAKTILMSGSC